MRDTELQWGKVPPNAVEIEKLVIGTCLIDAMGLSHVEKVFTDNEQVFYDPRHMEIYRAIASLRAKNNPVDMMTVIQELRKTGSLDKAGGDLHIIDLTMGVSSSAHIEYHCRLIFEKYIARKIIEAGSAMIDKAYNEKADIFEILDMTNAETNRIGAYLTGQKPIKSFMDVQKQFMEYITSENVPGVPIPFRKLQEENQGWQDSDLIIIAGRPGMGKTALALEIAKHSAKCDYPVHFFSLEMANIQLHKRIISNELNISSNRIRKKRLTDDDLQKIYRAGELEKIPFFYDDGLFIWEEIKARARQVAAEKKTKLIVIDYLQLIGVKQKMSTIDRITYISREMKMLAKELSIPVIALSQLSRGVESRPDKKPNMADLRDSGAIEQDADIILFPYRPEYYGIESWNEENEDGSESSTHNRALLISAKNRHCGESDLVIGWNPEYQKFFDLDGFVEPTYTIPQGSIEDAF